MHLQPFVNLNRLDPELPGDRQPAPSADGLDDGVGIDEDQVGLVHSPLLGRSDLVREFKAVSSAQRTELRTAEIEEPQRLPKR